MLEVTVNLSRTKEHSFFNTAFLYFLVAILTLRKRTGSVLCRSALWDFLVHGALALLLLVITSNIIFKKFIPQKYPGYQKIFLSAAEMFRGWQQAESLRKKTSPLSARVTIKTFKPNQEIAHQKSLAPRAPLKQSLPQSQM